MKHRPDRLVLFTGTGTEVGKTWVAAQTVRLLVAERISCATRKPVQSFAPGDITDAEHLAAATGEGPEQVCPRHRWYERPLAPPMAAAELGRPPFTIADLAAETTWPDGIAVGIVEGIGGPRSPIAADGDTIDLAVTMHPDLVVLVSGAQLGAINAVRLCADALRPWPVVVVLNRYNKTDALHAANRSWLSRHASLDVVVGPAELAARLKTF